VNSVRIDVPDGAGEQIQMLLGEAFADPGPVILYLHGFASRQGGEKGRFFRARAAAAGIPFASIDFRGHGASDGRLRDVTVERNLADIAVAQEWLGRRGFGPIALFGSSMGGAAALWRAALAPTSTCAVIAIAPALDTLARLESDLGPEGMEQWRREGTTTFRTELVETEVGWGLAEGLLRHRPEELAARLETPALLFHGQRDATVDWRVSAELARRARPGLVRARLLEDGDHRLLERLDLIWRESEAELQRAFAAAGEGRTGVSTGR